MPHILSSGGRPSQRLYQLNGLAHYDPTPTTDFFELGKDDRRRKAEMSLSDVHGDTNIQINLSTPFARTNVEPTLHAEDRTYSAHKFTIEGFEGVALLDAHVRDFIRDPFHIPHRPSIHAFEIAHARDKGYGMFARQDIPIGGEILVEHPIVVTPSLTGLRASLSEVYADLFCRLPPPARQKLMSLANCRPIGCSLEEGILRTNAIPIDLNVFNTPDTRSHNYLGIFLKTSRCNHSCGPNANYEWDLNSLSLTLEAARPIRAGEEITIPYVALDQPLRERRAKLHSRYGFHCNCQYCHLPDPSAVVQSNLARRELMHFWTRITTFERWCLDLSMEDHALIEAHKRALAIIEQEGLETLHYTKHVDTITMCYGALGDVEMFRHWVEKVRQIRVEKNPEHSAVFRKWSVDPYSFHVWGWRKRLKELVPKNCV